MKSLGILITFVFLLSGCSGSFAEGPPVDCGTPRMMALVPGMLRTTFACQTDTAQPSEDCSDGLATLGVAAYEDVYAFETRDPARVSFLVERDEQEAEEGLGRPRLILFLRDGSGDPANELGCYRGDKLGGRSLIMVDLLPGRYTLFVESYAQEGKAVAHYRLHTAIDCGPNQRFSVVSNRCEADPAHHCTGQNQHGYVDDSQGGYHCACDPGAIVDPANYGRCQPDPMAGGESTADPILLTGASGHLTVRLDTAANDETPVCALGEEGDRVFALYAETRGRFHLQATTGGAPAGEGLRVAVRRASPSPAAEIACFVALPITEDLDPGLYYLIMEPEPGRVPSGPFEVDYRFEADPCGADACPENADCVRNSGGSFECLCPAGMSMVNGRCAFGPCAAAPCAQENRTRCVAEPGGGHQCECASGYIDQGGACVSNPTAVHWTILVYLAIDDPLLDSFGTLLQQDVQRACASVACGDVVRLVVFEDTLWADGGRSRVASITHSAGNNWSIIEIEDWGERTSADSRTFTEFGRWAVQRYPAQHYLLLLGGHGAGWRRITSDRTDGGAISLAKADYARALASLKDAIGRPIDVVVLDSCYMGMWEVAHATAPYGDYLIASEPMMGGVSVERLVASLMEVPDQSAEQVARLWIDAPDEWQGGFSARAFAVVDLRKIAPLSEAISALAETLSTNTTLMSNLASARLEAHHLRNGEYVDIGELAGGVSTLDGVPDSWVLGAQAVAAQLEQAVPYRFADPGYSSLSGLTIYLPARGRPASLGYRAGTWAQDTYWDELLEAFNGYLDVREAEVHRFSL